MARRMDKNTYGTESENVKVQDRIVHDCFHQIIMSYSTILLLNLEYSFIVMITTKSTTLEVAIARLKVYTVQAGTMRWSL